MCHLGLVVLYLLPFALMQYWSMTDLLTHAFLQANYSQKGNVTLFQDSQEICLPSRFYLEMVFGNFDLSPVHSQRCLRLLCLPNYKHVLASLLPSLGNRAVGVGGQQRDQSLMGTTSLAASHAASFIERLEWILYFASS